MPVGEEDSQNQTNAQNYANNLGGLINALRTEPWFPAEIPMVINQLHAATNTVYATTVRNAQATVVAARSDNVRLLNNDDLTLYTDRIHYTNPMQLEVGRRLANIFSPAVPEPSTIEIAFAALCTLGSCGRRGPIFSRPRGNDRSAAVHACQWLATVLIQRC